MYDSSDAGLQAFMQQFKFDPTGKGMVGVEREFFIFDPKKGVIVPRAQEVLSRLVGINRRYVDKYGIEPFGYELPACQIELRIRRLEISKIKDELQYLERILDTALDSLGLSKISLEVAPKDVPQDVYPDPDGRYADITRHMEPEVLLAACRVIGTHFHVGMPDPDTALAVYNEVIGSCDELVAMGDNSGGLRLAVYSVVEPDPRPQPYISWNVFYRHGVEAGFADHPRRLWKLIRVTRYGTIEFRMFGVTDDIDKVVSWGTVCHRKCADVLARL